jgi:hypothetical protein
MRIPHDLLGMEASYVLKGKKPLERPRCRWEDNIKIVLEWSGTGLNSPGSRQGPVTGSRELGNELTGSAKCCEIENLVAWRLLLLLETMFHFLCN